MAAGFVTGVLPAAVTAVVSTGLAVAVNIATDDDRTGLIAWLAVAALTVATVLLSLWSRRTDPAGPPPTPVPQQRIDSSMVGGSVNQVGSARRVVIRRPSR